MHISTSGRVERPTFPSRWMGVGQRREAKRKGGQEQLALATGRLVVDRTRPVRCSVAVFTRSRARRRPVGRYAHGDRIDMHAQWVTLASFKCMRSKLALHLYAWPEQIMSMVHAKPLQPPQWNSKSVITAAKNVIRTENYLRSSLKRHRFPSSCSCKITWPGFTDYFLRSTSFVPNFLSQKWI